MSRPKRFQVVTNLYIPYYRVSTKRQGESGLGLEAQHEQVNRAIQLLNGVAAGPSVVLTDPANPNPSPITAIGYKEIETGKKSKRPQLAAAVEDARTQNATLIVSKMDRLTRNVLFLSQMIESDVNFTFADDPTFTKHDPMKAQMLAVFAENEARQISRRTIAALAARKARGAMSTIECVRANTRNHPDGPKTPGSVQNKDAAMVFALSLKNKVEEILNDAFNYEGRRYDGKLSIGYIGERLEEEDIKTQSGSPKWHRTAVRRLLCRLKESGMRIDEMLYGFNTLDNPPTPCYDAMVRTHINSREEATQ